MQYLTNTVAHYNATNVDGVKIQAGGKTLGYWVNTYKATGWNTAQFYFKGFDFANAPSNIWGAPMLFNFSTTGGNNRAIAINMTDTSTTGALQVTGIEVLINSPSDRGGDSSGIYVNQSGGGNGISIYKLGGGGTGFAIEAGADGGNHTIFASSENGYLLHGKITGTGGGVNIFPEQDTITTYVDQDSNSGQKVLYVASTQGFGSGNAVIIDEGGSREETLVIDTVQSGVSLTMTTNLSYTHTAADGDSVKNLAAPYRRAIKVSTSDNLTEKFYVDLSGNIYTAGSIIGHNAGTSDVLALFANTTSTDGPYIGLYSNAYTGREGGMDFGIGYGGGNNNWGFRWFYYDGSFNELARLVKEGDFSLIQTGAAFRPLLDGRGRVMAQGVNEIRLTVNASYDGTNWNRDDTNKPAWAVKLDDANDIIKINHVDSGGTNPITWVEFLRLTKDKQLGLGVSDPGGTSGQPGDTVIHLANATNEPDGTLNDGGALLYASGGELYVYDANGNATLISPHNEDGKWVFRSTNKNTGRHYEVDMEKLIALVEKLTGEEIARIWYE